MSLVHEKRKSYKCKTCEKSFQTNQNLKVHNSRVHSVTTDTSVMENTGQDENNAL